MPPSARFAPLTRRGPLVHALLSDAWEQRRAFLVMRPLQCRICRLRVERGEMVVRTLGDLGFACGNCAPTHIRGDAACPLCDLVRLSGPRCRHCGGTGYGEQG